MNPTFIYNVANLLIDVRLDLRHLIETAAFLEDPNIDQYSHYSENVLLTAWLGRALDRGLGIGNTAQYLAGPALHLVQQLQIHHQDRLIQQLQGFPRHPKFFETPASIRLSRWDLYITYKGAVS